MRHQPATPAQQWRRFVKAAVEFQRRWRWGPDARRWAFTAGAVVLTIIALFALLAVVPAPEEPVAIVRPTSTVARAIARQSTNARDDYTQGFWLSRVKVGDGAAGEIDEESGQRAREALEAPFITSRDFEAELLAAPHEWQQRFFFFITKPLKKASRGGGGASGGDKDQLLHLFLSSLYVTHPNAKVYAVLTVDGDDHRREVSEAVAPYIAMGYHLRALQLAAADLPHTGWWLTEGNRAWLERWFGEGAQTLSAAQAPYLYSHVTDYLRFWFLSTYGGTYTDSDAIFTAPLPSGSFVGIDRSLDTAGWFLDPEGHMYAAPGLLRLPPGAPEAQAVLADAFNNDAYDPKCFNCVGPRPFNTMLRELVVAAQAEKAAADAAAASGGAAGTGSKSRTTVFDRVVARVSGRMGGGGGSGNGVQQTALEAASEALGSVGSRLQLLPPMALYPLTFLEVPELFKGAVDVRLQRLAEEEAAHASEEEDASSSSDDDHKRAAEEEEELEEEELEEEEIPPSPTVRAQHEQLLRRLQRSSYSLHLFGHVTRKLPIRTDSFVAYLLEQLNLRAVGTKAFGSTAASRTTFASGSVATVSSACTVSIVGGLPMVVAQARTAAREHLTVPGGAAAAAVAPVDAAVAGAAAAAAAASPSKLAIFSSPSNVFFRNCDELAAARSVEVEVSTAQDSSLQLLTLPTSDSGVKVVATHAGQSLRVTIEPATVQAVNSVLRRLQYRPPVIPAAASTGARGGSGPAVTEDEITVRIASRGATTASGSKKAATVGLHHSVTFPMLLLDQLVTAVPYAHGPDSVKHVTAAAGVFSRMFPGTAVVAIADEAGASVPLDADSPVTMRVFPGIGASAAWQQVLREDVRTPYVFMWDADRFEVTSQTHIDLLLLVLTQSTSAEPVHIAAAAIDAASKSAMTPGTLPAGASGVLQRSGPQGATLNVTSHPPAAHVSCSVVDLAPAAFLARTKYLTTVRPLDTSYSHASLLPWMVARAIGPTSQRTSRGDMQLCTDVTVRAVATTTTGSPQRRALLGRLLSLGRSKDNGAPAPAPGSWVAVDVERLQADMLQLLLLSRAGRLTINGVEAVAPATDIPVADDGERLVGHKNEPPTCKPETGRCVTGNEGQVAVAAARAKWQAALAPEGRKLRIGFVTFATGPYNAFVEDLWAGLQRWAFPHQEVHLFVFTDKAGNSSFLQHPHVHKKYQTRLGWPFDSLARHFLYLRHVHWFASMDFLYSVDSDAAVVGPLDETMLGERVGTFHYWFFGRPSHELPNDRRWAPTDTHYSSAFISYDETHQAYVCGGMFGGTYEGFRAILEGVVALASADLAHHPPRVALWHDESYLNRYFLDSPATLLLAPNYMYPEAPVDRFALQASGKWEYHTMDGTRFDKAEGDLLTPYSRRRRFVPRVLNLGVRKHVTNTVTTMQPPTTTIPAVMTEDDVARVVPAVDKAFVAERMTFIIKAFERPTCLVRLLRSIHQFYPTVPVLVLDDSKQPMLPRSAEVTREMHQLLPNLKYIRSEYDVGLAEGRNRLLQHVETPYVLLLDDDFEILDTSNIEHLLGVLEYGTFDIAGGCIDSAWGYHVLPEPGRLEIKMDMGCKPADGTPRAADYESETIACFKTDMINNFFGARVDFVRQVLWDPRLKMGEHEDFFWRVKDAGGRVGLCRGITAKNDNSCDKTPQYKKLRSRVFDYWVTLFQKHNITQMKTAAGVYTLQCEGTEEARPATGATARDKHAVAAAPAGKCRIDVKQDSIWFN